MIQFSHLWWEKGDEDRKIQHVSTPVHPNCARADIACMVSLSFVSAPMMYRVTRVGWAAAHNGKIDRKYACRYTAIV